MIFAAVIAFIAVIIVFKGLKIVPEQQAWVIEKLGKYDRTLQPGLNLIIPFIERIAYKHTLKEDAIDVTQQTAITNDNVSLAIDGVLYVRIVDAVAASYGVSNPYYAITQLAQTTMRSEIGKITMDKTFEERDSLNSNIVQVINEAANSWGIQCMRYEIKDITPPETVRRAMELQVAAERQKRAEILESEGKRQALINDSEGKRQAQINVAEAYKQEIVLRSEAALTDQVNRARGEAEAVTIVADATAKGISILADALASENGKNAASLRVAEQYIDAFRQLARQGTTVLLPANAHDAGSMSAQALSIFTALSGGAGKGEAHPSVWENSGKKG